MNIQEDEEQLENVDDAQDFSMVFEVEEEEQQEELQDVEMNESVDEEEQESDEENKEPSKEESDSSQVSDEEAKPSPLKVARITATTPPMTGLQLILANQRGGGGAGLFYFKLKRQSF